MIIGVFFLDLIKFIIIFHFIFGYDFAKAKKPLEMNISETDLTIILSNVIKNAYEAAEKSTNTNKEISITITHSPNRVYLQVKNPAIRVPKLENGIIVSNKEDRDNHGIGLRNIEKAVNRYQGVFNMTFDSGYMVVELEF